MASAANNPSLDDVLARLKDGLARFQVFGAKFMADCAEINAAILQLAAVERRKAAAAAKIQTAVRGFLARRYTQVLRAENQATPMLLSVTAAKQQARQEVVAADTNAASDPILPLPSICYFSRSVCGRSARQTARAVAVRDQRTAAASFCRMALTRCERSSKPACRPPRARRRSRPAYCSGDKATTRRRPPRARLRIGRDVKGLFLGIGLERQVVAHRLHCSSRTSCSKRGE